MVSSVRYQDDRVRRRNRACAAAGLLAGGGMGVLAGAFGWPSAALLVLVGGLAGGLAGRAIGLHISADEWDPPPANQRPYVGTNSPDDDIARD